jgi:hypothetical protein
MLIFINSQRGHTAGASTRSKVSSYDGLLTPFLLISGILESDLGDHSRTSLRKAAVFYGSCVDEGNNI